jgi:hypothetical protein
MTEKNRQLEISKETIEKIESFRPVIELVIGGKMESLDYYAELVMEIGLEKMVTDILPRDNKELQQTIATMFKKNPKFVSEFILGVLQTESEEGKEELKVEWTPGYR